MAAQTHLAQSAPSFRIRAARPEDAPAAGQVCYEAFQTISTDHGFPSDFPSPQVASGVLSGMFSYSGLTKAQVERLRDEFSIYAVDTGRICVAALNSKNIDNVVAAIAKVL